MLLTLLFSIVLLLGCAFADGKHADSTEDAEKSTTELSSSQVLPFWQFYGLSPMLVVPPNKPLLNYNQQLVPWWYTYAVDGYYHSHHLPMETPSELDYSLNFEFRPHRFKTHALSWDYRTWNYMNPDPEGSGQSRHVNQFFNTIASFLKIPSTALNLPNSNGCRDASGLEGLCIPSFTCASSGGSPIGKGAFDINCCIHKVNKCSGVITQNNTYWESPAILKQGICTLNINTASNSALINQPICQVRLDFLKLSLEKPNPRSGVCDIDSLTVEKTRGSIPTICGENTGQHMYLTPLKENGNLVVQIKTGLGTFSRSWQIQVSMLPCGAQYLAPRNCLQYFPQPAGGVTSFDYVNVTSKANASRQLEHQDYKSCFGEASIDGHPMRGLEI